MLLTERRIAPVLRRNESAVWPYPCTIKIFDLLKFLVGGLVVLIVVIEDLYRAVNNADLVADSRNILVAIDVKATSHVLLSVFVFSRMPCFVVFKS